jgi:hypothetical protein
MALRQTRAMAVTARKLKMLVQLVVLVFRHKSNALRRDCAAFISNPGCFAVGLLAIQPGADDT